MYSIAQKHIDEGIEKGIEQGIIKIANNMLKANFNLKDIARATGLSEEDVMKLKANL